MIRVFHYPNSPLRGVRRTTAAGRVYSGSLSSAGYLDWSALSRARATTACRALSRGASGRAEPQSRRRWDRI